MQACGVCHTDLHYREGGINDEFPFLLGHEAAGVVEAVGEGVTERRPRRLRDPQLAGGVRQLPRLPAGPSLVLLRHPQRHPEDDPRRRHGAAAPPSASAPSPRRRWSPQGSAPRSTRDARPAVAGLLGCGVMAGLGAAINTGGVTRGDTVAVIGCGGVGERGHPRVARLAGAARIIAVDVDDRKLGLGQASSAPPTRSTPRPPTRSRRSRSSPAGTAPTS